MPIYEYRCQGCGDVFEVFQRASDPPPAQHACGATEVVRQLSHTSFVLKGTGWYKTDYPTSREAAQGRREPAREGGEAGAEKAKGKADGAAAGGASAGSDAKAAAPATASAGEKAAASAKASAPANAPVAKGGAST